MKITFVITNLATGGAEMMLFKLLRHLDRNRFEPTVISLVGIGDIGPSIAALGISIYSLNMKRGGVPNPLILIRLIWLLRKCKPDVVHTWMYHADFLGGIAARLAGFQNVVWGLHNADLPAETTKLSTRIVMKVCAILSSWIPICILSCSNRAKAVHLDEGYCESKMRVIPNGFERDVFVPDVNARRSLRLELGLDDKTQLVGMMARYDPQKNHFGFLDAAALVARELPQVHFVLAGSGIVSANTALQAQIVAHRLEDKMHLLGRREDMPRLMAGLDVLASSSHSEAFSLVLCEAMGCGVLCVVTEAGDPANIVGDIGRVVPTGDVVGLARGIIEVLQLPESKRSELGCSARKYVSKNYDIRNMVNAYQDLYDHMPYVK